MQLTSFTSLSIFSMTRNAAAKMFDEIQTAIKESACPVPVFNLE
jgi:hypothetical protein